jgi:hypothetical protein
MEQGFIHYLKTKAKQAKRIAKQYIQGRNTSDKEKAIE